jgi:hypothetical protein
VAASHTVDPVAAIAAGGPVSNRNGVKWSEPEPGAIAQSDVASASMDDSCTNQKTSPRAAGGMAHAWTATNAAMIT